MLIAVVRIKGERERDYVGRKLGVFKAVFLHCCPDCPSRAVDAIQMGTQGNLGSSKEL